jgi:ubiquinone/menaquinone biosynthesis C-methylase UbiE
MKNNRFTEAFNYLKTIADPSELISGDRDYLVRSKLRWQMLLHLLPSSGQKLRVLDIGTGYGHMAVFIKRVLGHEVYAVECHNSYEERLRKEGVIFKECNLNTELLPFEDSFFDVVLFTEVIEHMFALPQIILLDIKRVLKPQGLLILSTQNMFRLFNRALFLLGKRLTLRLNIPGVQNLDFKSARNYADIQSLIHSHWQKQENYGAYHLQLYDMRELKSLLNETGYKVTLARYLQFVDVFKDMRGHANFNPVRIAYKAAYKLICKIYAPFGSNILITAQKE